MVLGYWDGNGFGNLVPGSAATQTAAVNDMIGTQGPSSNYTDYCLPLDFAPAPIQPDLSEPPAGDEHADNCVADYMKTSQSLHDNYYGWSWFSHVGPAVENYVSSLGQGYVATSSNYYMGSSLTWTLLQNEIDAGRPMVFLVDTDADDTTDHFVTVVGYDSPGGVRKYGCLDTYGTSVRWEDFQQMASGQSWGVHGAVAFQMASSNHAPAVGTVVPSHGSGAPGQLTWFITSWTDSDGWEDLKQCYFHIGDSPSLVGNVTLLYNAQRDRLWIRSDDGLEWLGGCTPGSDGLPENSQAILHCADSRKAAGGDMLEMKWGLEFKKDYIGAKKLGLKARDSYGARARGEWKGTWTIE
jgi:hypothetical protein